MDEPAKNGDSSIKMAVSVDEQGKIGGLSSEMAVFEDRPAKRDVREGEARIKEKKFAALKKKFYLCSPFRKAEKYKI